MAICLVLISSQAFANNDPLQTNPPVVVTAPDDLRDLKVLVEKERAIRAERKLCSETAKDIKQECFCDKSADYKEIAKLANDITLPEHRRNWFDSLLKFEDNGKTVTTSLINYQNIEQEFLEACLPNEDGTYRANHEGDKPLLKVTDDEDVQKLVFLKKQKRKWFFKSFECWSSGRYTREECACGYKAKFQALLSHISSLLRDHPSWKDHVLSIMIKNHVNKISLETEIREITDYVKACKK
jgi:hypothetical protein